MDELSWYNPFHLTVKVSCNFCRKDKQNKPRNDKINYFMNNNKCTKLHETDENEMKRVI